MTARKRWTLMTELSRSSQSATTSVFAGFTRRVRPSSRRLCRFRDTVLCFKEGGFRGHDDVLRVASQCRSHSSIASIATLPVCIDARCETEAASTNTSTAKEQGTPPAD